MGSKDEILTCSRNCRRFRLQGAAEQRQGHAACCALHALGRGAPQAVRERLRGCRAQRRQGLRGADDPGDPAAQSSREWARVVCPPRRIFSRRRPPGEPGAGVAKQAEAGGSPRRVRFRGEKASFAGYGVCAVIPRQIGAVREPAAPGASRRLSGDAGLARGPAIIARKVTA